MNAEKQIDIYQTADGQTRIEVQLQGNTVWLSQAQRVELFGRDVSVISRHIRNALEKGEVSEKSNLQKMHIANTDRPVTFYHLDVVISAGYRIKSPLGVQFRRWATQRLREYLVQGYSLNRARFDKNAAELKQVLALGGLHDAGEMLFLKPSRPPCWPSYLARKGDPLKARRYGQAGAGMIQWHPSHFGSASACWRVLNSCAWG